MRADSYLDAAQACAEDAGERILAIYERAYSISEKGDGSPLTEADLAAHRCIVERLARIDGDIPILSEESAQVPYTERARWRRFWLVDPLDGTKEFIQRNGQFTVNIALIDDGRPVLGVVHAPVTATSYVAARGVGAFKQIRGAPRSPIRTRRYQGGKAIVVASRSHAGELVAAFIARLSHAGCTPELRSMGSSLKLCLVAEGEAHVYPRLGPTSEWDTAAAHCVVEEAGGRVIGLDGETLRYNKASLLNPYFLATAGEVQPWLDYCMEADER